MYYFWGFLISLMFIVLTLSAVADHHHKHNWFLFFMTPSSILSSFILIGIMLTEPGPKVRPFFNYAFSGVSDPHIQSFRRKGEKGKYHQRHVNQKVTSGINLLPLWVQY